MCARIVSLHSLWFCAACYYLWHVGIFLQLEHGSSSERWLLCCSVSFGILCIVCFAFLAFTKSKCCVYYDVVCISVMTCLHYVCLLSAYAVLTLCVGACVSRLQCNSEVWCLHCQSNSQSLCSHWVLWRLFEPQHMGAGQSRVCVAVPRLVQGGRTIIDKREEDGMESVDLSCLFSEWTSCWAIKDGSLDK